MSKKSYAVWTAAAALFLATQARAVIIEIGTANGEAGATVDLGVSLIPEDSVVAGTQNDTTFSGGPGAEVRIAAKTNGRPDCTVNPDINKTGTSFAFQPPGCSGDACTAVRALVLALDNVCPICGESTEECPVPACPVVMYTCKVSIAEGTAAGTFPMTNSNVGASDPDGGSLPTTGTDGAVIVGGAPPGGTTIAIGSASGDPGDRPTIDVTLDAEDAIAGTQNDITFEPQAAIAALGNGRPMCTVNPAINKTGTSFAFQPPGCTVGTTCTGVRALVLALDNVCPICAEESTTECPDLPTCPVTMYTCTVAIAEDAADGEYPLTCSNAGASDPDGGAVEAACTDGSVTVPGEPVEGTPTNTPEATPTNTVPTVVNTPTNTPFSGNTPTAVFTPIIITTDDDACAIASPATTSSGWLVLLPVAALLWLRRRSR